mmetsp:Transcript_68093/g.162533  ORF Transcript_68093/g.162533 Transcript_68093/m.162533 type:complete len:207 (-) Transcript_68093:269-889(-)
MFEGEPRGVAKEAFAAKITRNSRVFSSIASHPSDCCSCFATCTATGIIITHVAVLLMMLVKSAVPAYTMQRTPNGPECSPTFNNAFAKAAAAPVRVIAAEMPKEAAMVIITLPLTPSIASRQLRTFAQQQKKSSAKIAVAKGRKPKPFNPIARIKPPKHKRPRSLSCCRPRRGGFEDSTAAITEKSGSRSRVSGKASSSRTSPCAS